MIPRLILLLTLMALMATHACGGYRDLMKEFDDYRPPSYVKAREKAAPEHEPPPADVEFDSEKKRIMEAAKKWKRSLTAGGDERSSFGQPARLLKMLQPASTDVHVAEAALARRFSLETLETLAFVRNPGVKAAEARLRAAIETFSQVLNLDEILRRYTAFTEGLMTGVGPMKGKDPVKTKFPFPGVLALKGEIVGQEVAAAREDLERARREAVTGAGKTYWNLLFVQKAETITEETLDLLKYLEEVAGSLYEAGRTSFQDVIKVRIEREILEEELITLREKGRNIESKIREILNLSPSIKIGSPEGREPVRKIPTLDSLYPLALERRQELRRIRAMVGKTERMIEMAETMILPPYTLNLSLYEDEAVTQVGSVATREDFPISTKASTGAGLPKMPWYGTNDAYLRQTRQRLQALREDLKKAEAETLTLVRNAWFELDRAKREESLYKDSIIKLSRSALDVSSRGYESGNVSFADVISSYTIWLKANLAAEEKRSDLGIAWAELERAVGRSLR
jgi:outer membrane protein TolC